MNPIGHVIANVAAVSVVLSATIVFFVALFPTYETSLWFRWRYRCRHLDGWLNECVHYQHCVWCGERRRRSRSDR